MNVQIQILSDWIGTRFPLPSYATEGAAGLDLCACVDGPVTIPPGDAVLIPTGIAVAVPEGCVGLLAARSGMGIRHQVQLSNGVGVIDSDYRGPVRVGLHNFGQEPYTVSPGDRIAQLVIVPVQCPSLQVVEALPETARGTGGLGSTGR